MANSTPNGSNASTASTQHASWDRLANASSRMATAYSTVADVKAAEAYRIGGMEGMEGPASSAMAEAGAARQDAATYGSFAGRFRQFAAQAASAIRRG